MAAMNLLRRLHDLQHAHGHLTPDALRDLAAQENVPLYRLQGLVSFYPHFRTTPPPRVEVAVCRDLSCWLAGGEEQWRRLRESVDGRPDVEVREVSCLGRCETAPAAAVNGHPVPLGEADRWEEWLRHPDGVPAPPPHGQQSFRCDPYSS